MNRCSLQAYYYITQVDSTTSKWTKKIVKDSPVSSQLHPTAVTKFAINAKLESESLFKIALPALKHGDATV